MKKLAIITTHPIQYYAPVFKLLHERGNIGIKIFYTWGERALAKFDPGFGKEIAWDIPFLEGYPYTWLINTAADPGTHHVRGIINPNAVSEINAWQPDAVLFFGWGWQGHLKTLRYFNGRIPVYFRGDSTLLNESRGWKQTLRARLLRWVFRHVDTAFYVGTHNKAYYKKYGLKDSQLIFAPHAIDNDRFMTDHTAEAASLREQLGIEQDQVLLLYAGKYETVKNVPLLLSAFLKLQNPEVHLLLVGNGPFEAQLKKNAGGHPLVHFMDFQNQSRMPVIYQAGDLFCLPSRSETWGLAVNEVMASGRAVLVSDQVGCAPDLVKNGKNGAIFESGNGEDLLLCLEQLTGSRERLREMGARGRRFIRDWNFTRIAETIEEELNQRNNAHE